jgi:hypothetical protein
MINKIKVIIFSTISVGCISVEQQKYFVVDKMENFEIRKYPPAIIAEVSVNDDFKKAGNSGFRILLDFISGKNKQNSKIKMTAPVDQSLGSEKIKMTAPVEMIGNKNNYIIRFVMPEKYTLEKLPKPLDKRIIVKKTPETKKAARIYYGSWSEENFKTNKEILINSLDKSNIKWSGNVIFARYNSPLTLWFLKKNEIIVNLE